MYIIQNSQGTQGSPSESSPDSPATEPPSVLLQQPLYWFIKGYSYTNASVHIFPFIFLKKQTWFHTLFLFFFNFILFLNFT